MLTDRYGVESIAFCCISTGVFGFPQKEAAKITVSTVKQYLAQKSQIRTVVFNVFQLSDYKIYRELLGADRELQTEISNAEAILIGAGAGLSTAAGFTYSGERLQRYFSDFTDKYHCADMYTVGFYPYQT